MDKSQYLLELEIEQLRSRIESEPEKVFVQAEQCLIRARQIHFTSAIIESLIIMSRCLWCKMDYRTGFKYIKEAYQNQLNLETDHFLPEILHIHALHHWGQAKYYTAQQFWINALEQSALVDEPEIEIECLIGLGNIWRITGEYKLACSTHELAVKVANNTRIDWLEGKARILWAWDLYHLNQYVDMLTVLDGAEEVLQNNSNVTWQAEVWDFRGLALLGLERLEDAEEATRKAHELAVENNLTWMKAHSFISRARLELLRKNFSVAAELLSSAEKAASSFDNGELLSQICYQQSRVAEENGDPQAALTAFKKYRRYTVMMLRDEVCELEGMYKTALVYEKKAFRIESDLMKRIPISELGPIQLRRLSRFELQLKLILSELENRELKETTESQKNTVLQLQQDVFTDPLTKLHNRRWLDVKLKDLLLHETPFAFLVVDIDHFKSINDELSHLVGDKVIVNVSSELASYFKFRGASCVRFGGEEFLVILENVTSDMAQMHAETYRQRIFDFPWQDVLGERGLTVSIGITLHREGENTQRTFYRADKALYRAKANGRNQVCVE
ncbi:Response regulator PleD [Vibrio cholerae]|nr:Response regulator PleD [Vibrio cholerae]